MLYGLGRRHKACVKGGCALIFGHDFGTLIDDPVNGRACLALGPFADQFEDLFQALDLGLGFGAVFFKSGGDFLAFCGLCHLGQGSEDFFSA